MNVADALLICQVAPDQRRLRVSHVPEASMGLTALVSCGVASFFIIYFGLLLLFFTVSSSPGIHSYLTPPPALSCAELTPQHRSLARPYKALDLPKALQPAPALLAQAVPAATCNLSIEGTPSTAGMPWLPHES